MTVPTRCPRCDQAQPLPADEVGTCGSCGVYDPANVTCCHVDRCPEAMHADTCAVWSSDRPCSCR